MVYRYACDSGITDNFVTVFFFNFELSHIWGLNTMYVHNCGYFVCETPPTVYTDQLKTL